MSQKWNLQDIRPAQSRKKRVIEGGDVNATKKRQTNESRKEVSGVISNSNINRSVPKRHTLVYTVSAFLLITIIGLAVSVFIGGAEVTVYPKHRELNVNASFEAMKTPSSGELPYEIMTLEAEGERQVTVSGEEQVTTQAVGTIFIYNIGQKDSLRLVTNTRFESPDGLLFKIKDSAVVPGYTVDESGNKIAGVTTAEVYSDQAGEKYNIGTSKFTIPGFKDEPEYETVYAESTTDFTGGYDGTKFVINEEELQKAQQELRTELRNSLQGRIVEEKPAGFVLFADAATFAYVSLPSVAYGENLATIKEKVVLNIPLFKEEDFARYIAQASIPGYEGDSVRINNYDTFTFGYTGSTTNSTDINNNVAISFNLSGKPQIVWTFDNQQLKKDLLDKSKTALTSVLSGYPAIEKASAALRPVWKTKFPSKLSELTIIEIIEGTE